MKLDVIIPVGPGHEKIVEEAIQSVQVACETDRGTFEEVSIRPVDDTHGLHGRSKARNVGIRTSRADWLFFLDADDLMYPDALKTMEKYLHYDAVWGLICEWDKNKIKVRDGQIPQILFFETLLEADTFLTLQMGFFVKRTSMCSFDESLSAGEDWKAYLTLWKNRKCIKQKQPFMLNRRDRHSSVSVDGLAWRTSVEKIVRDVSCGKHYRMH